MSGARTRPGRRFPFVVATFAVLATLAAGAPARAHIVNDREAKVLAKLPQAAGSVIEALPDSAGWCAGNRRGDFDVTRQIPALRALADAASRGDAAAAERGWAAIDAAFTLQRPGGRFERIVGGVPADTARAWADAVPWIAELNRTVAVVLNGPLQARFQSRWALTRLRLQISMNGLVDQALTIESKFASDPGRMMRLAEAFLLADGHYHDTKYGLAGQRAMVAGLRSQRRDGSFGPPGHAGWATDIACLDAIEALDLYFPGPFLDRASDRLTPRIEARVPSATHGARKHVARATRELDELSRRVLAIRAGRKALGPPQPMAPHGEMFGKTR